MSKQNTAADTNNTEEAAPFSDDGIDEPVVNQSNTDEAWDEPIYVQQQKSDSASAHKAKRSVMKKKNRAR
ncbi:MAG: hypothetical protein H0T92_21405 [Pyrinomonadaceae bacterium]|nr:hypothetical protein [Pyrinomonadaceae bacterium]